MPEYIYPLQHFLYYYVLYGPPPKITYHIRFHYMARNDHHHQKFPALFSKTNKSQKKKCLKSCSTKLLFLWCLLNELCSFPWFRSPTPDKGCSFQGQCTVAKNGQKCRITRQFQRMTKKSLEKWLIYDTILCGFCKHCMRIGSSDDDQKVCNRKSIGWLKSHLYAFSIGE